MRYLFSALAVAIIASCAAPATGTSAPTVSPTADAPSDAVVTIDASWPVSYASLSDIAADSDLIVAGTVASIAFQGPDPEDPSLPLTLFNIDVEKVIRGSAPNSIVVSQTGGPMKGQMVAVDGDPLMASADQVVLYLKKVVTGPGAGRYFIVGGPQGRLMVRADGTLGRIGDSNVQFAPDLTVPTLAADHGNG